MTFETFLWSRLKRRVHCRSLHIHVPSQKRVCSDAKEEASQREIHLKNKKLQPLPLLECQEICLCFVVFCFLITPSTDGQQSPISSEKFTQQDGQTWAASSTDKKPFLQNKALLLGQFILVIHIQIVPGQSQACTVLLGPAIHILSINLIDS